jgi:hypothetical protein
MGQINKENSGGDDWEGSDGGWGAGGTVKYRKSILNIYEFFTCRFVTISTTTTKQWTTATTAKLGW